ncbi:hypothetical protein EV360DRAFT_86040 [Lentinula raphanica]|nr:hypothetical protein EV360DRAFT_86040 [Lentinula raphanica]
MGIFQESHEEQALQAHIRQLLYDYAKEHLTTSYVEFTEQAVAEPNNDVSFSAPPEALHVIPTTDNSSVRLPEEPFTALSQLYVLRELKRPYDEEASECYDTPATYDFSDLRVASFRDGGVELQKRIDGSKFTTLSPEEQNEVLSLRHWSHRTSEHLDSAEERPYENSMRTRKIDCGQHFWLARDQNEELDHEEREEEEREEREEAARQSELEASHTKAAVSANQFSPMQCN